MNTKKVFGYGTQNLLCVFAVMLTLSFIACDNGSTTTSGGNPTTITYTATQTGGADGTADSTGIVFTFSASVSNLIAANITVSGAAEGSGALTGSGRNWTLPITVTDAGLATVSINKTGIEAAAKSVTVYKAGAYVPEYWTINWNLNGGEKGTGAYPEQIVKGETLSRPSPDPTKTNSTFGGWYSDTGLTQTYNFASPVTANLNLYAKWETGQINPSDITYTVVQAGGTDGTTDSTGIVFTFSASVSSLTTADITVSGAASKGSATLSGTGTSWTLSPITVNAAGLATVSITKTGIEAEEKQVTVYKEGAAVPQTFTVTFDADGGSPAPQTQTVTGGGNVSEPATISKNGFEFDGWYKENTFDNVWDFDTDTVDENITIYAKWLHIYTVTFNSNGGTSVTPQTVIEGRTATAPNPAPTKAMGSLAGLWAGEVPASNTTFSFVEWRISGGNTAYDFNTPVTSNITIIAVWNPSSIDLSTVPVYQNNIIGKAAAYLNSNGVSGEEYTLVLDADVTDVGYIILEKNGVTLTITSIDNNERVISKRNGAYMFQVSQQAKLVIDGYVTLQGNNDIMDGNEVVWLNNGILELKGYAKITDNTSYKNFGSGVYAGGSTVTMSDNAEISNNTGSSYGGGVCLRNSTLTMNGNAAIKNNTVIDGGGGVYIGEGSTFTMNGGEISGNTAQSQGGGVYIYNDDSAQFIVESPASKNNITGNSVTGNNTSNGPQVYKGTDGVFTVDGVAEDSY
jgi:uncharacterized repeat protein (TIGR02543 family)